MVSSCFIAALFPAYSIPFECWYNGKIAAVVFTMAVLPLCLYGWGALFLKAFRMSDETIPLAMGVGLAGLLFIGGILNLLGVAYPLVLVSVLVAGAISSAGRYFARKVDDRKVLRRWSAERFIIAALIAVIMAFTVCFLLPPRALNVWDDFEKYFVYPVRMLQTGSLSGSPLSAIGSETLGGKAFLDGLIITFFPVAYINGTDAIMGLFLCLILVVQLAGDRERMFFATIAALLCVVIINPQYVNTSALYLGSALMILSIMLTIDPKGDSPQAFFPNSAALALAYAGIIALKNTFVLFPAVHLPLVALALFAYNKNARATGAWLVRVLLLLVLYLSPWILLHAPHFLAGLRIWTGETASGPNLSLALPLFSTKKLLYGDCAAHYTWMLVAATSGALAAGLVHWKLSGSLRQNSLMLMAASISGVTIYILNLLIMPTEVGVPTAIRYFAPFIIGIAPPVFVLTSVQAVSCAAKARTGIRRLCAVFPPALALLACLPFLPTAYIRVKQAGAIGSSIAFLFLSANKEYFLYNNQVLGGPARKDMEDAQQMVPEGEKILVWVHTAFYMNFSRNPIDQADTAGLTQRWADMPSDKYIIWEHAGYTYVPDERYLDMEKLPAAVFSKQGKKALEFRHKLEGLIEGAAKIYEDGSIALYKLNKPDGQK